MEVVNFFAGAELDRQAELRQDQGYVEGLLGEESTQVLVFYGMSPVGNFDDAKDRYHVVCTKFERLMPHIITRSHTNGNTLDNKIIVKNLMNDGKLIFLGLKSNCNTNVHYFAFDISAHVTLDNEFFEKSKILKSRADILKLSKHEASMVAQSRSMLDWNQRYKFCPTCGSATTSEDAGYKRKCNNDDCLSNGGVYNSSYPRTDPVVISVVVSIDRQRILLGRKKAFPPKMYSCLAGFVEPGESIEEAVRREVKEESGVTVGRVSYHSSQPWPYPSVLMIGCISFAESEEIKVCEEELEDVKWFEMNDIERALGTNSEFPTIPPCQTIAHHLIKSWLESSRS